MKWKVTIWRIGSSGQAGLGKTLDKAYSSATSQAGVLSLSGIDAGGNRFGPDIRDELDTHFKGAAKLIKGRKSCTRASSEKGHACVWIERI